ncbi:YihY/virulence factor BrkB family protein [Sphingomonas sp. J315]|uniref:YihY/virulence factor BrkB family protein n=1 Tax=Sphingomonas sp. J315 TaxID=2898433 RepID=UPI0021AE1CDE|nr:YihY/virulence factor BrkB family protein [Sphingomonas sp. J315]UUY00870.1 YihY/virulence factor BrkB family protein [Sphingomonas sp. J315]
MTEPVSPESPEARRHGFHKRLSDLGVTDRAIEVARRVAVGAYTDGFTHAGNLAYLSLVTLFPFFIVATAVARLVGRTGDGLQAVAAFLRTVPPEVADLLRPAILEVLDARSGSLLWLGALVGLWTTSGFIETVRSILRQAYGIPSGTPFWRLKLATIGMVIASVILAMMAFSFQVLLIGAEQFILRVLPFASDAARMISLTKVAPAIALFGALYILFYTLTPSRYRKSECPKWPGPAFVTLWWMGCTAALPEVISSFGGYGLTYGSLAGVMVALIFFFLIGFGVVIGAELNAALAETPENGLETPLEGTGG